MPRSLGAGSLAPTLGLPWEDAGGGTNLTVLLRSLVSANSGWWWDGTFGITVTGSGVSNWVDRNQSLALTQPTDAARPPYAGGVLTFSGAQDLFTASAFMVNATEWTSIVTMKAASQAAAASVVSITNAPNAAGARSFGLIYEFAGTSRLGSYGQTAGLVVNEWDTTSGVDTTAYHVFVGRVKFADGVSAAKPVRIDGVDAAGAASPANDISAGNIGSHSLALGALADASLGMTGTVKDLIVFPTSVSNAVADAAQGLLKSLRGTP